MELVRNDFVEPIPQPELGGALGLTAADIARSLGWDVYLVHQKLQGQGKSNGLFSRMSAKGLNIVQTRYKNSNGLEVSSYVMDVEAAKFFVARTDTDIADDYVLYLIRFEEAARKHFDNADPLMFMELTVKALRQNEAKVLKLESATQKLIESDNNARLNTDDIAAINAAIRARYQQFKLPSNRYGWLYKDLKNRFLPYGSRSRLTYKDMRRKDVGSAVQFIQTWAPQWQVS